MVNYILDIDLSTTLTQQVAVIPTPVTDPTLTVSAEAVVNLTSNAQTKLNQLFWFGSASDQIGDPSASSPVDISDITYAINFNKTRVDWPSDISYSEAYVIDSSGLLPTATDTSLIKHDLLRQHAYGIFGIASATDLFTNEDEIIQGVVNTDLSINTVDLSGVLNDISRGNLYVKPSDRLDGLAAATTTSHNKNIVRYLLSRLASNDANQYATMVRDNSLAWNGTNGYKTYSDLALDISNDVSAVAWNIDATTSKYSVSGGGISNSGEFVDMANSNPTFKYFPFQFKTGDTLQFKLDYRGPDISLAGSTPNNNNFGNRSYKIKLQF